MCELIRRIIIENIQDREDFLHVLRCLGALITAAGTCVPKLGIGCDARATGPSGVFQLDFLRSGGPEPSACLCFSTENTLTITERDSVCERERDDRNVLFISILLHSSFNASSLRICFFHCCTHAFIYERVHAGRLQLTACTGF